MTESKAGKIHLVQSDDEAPRVKLEVGKRYEVVATTIVDSELGNVGPGDERSRPARLCGSHSTCVAIVEIE
jgi:hypothetical protein